jgi:hypothetical protein
MWNITSNNVLQAKERLQLRRAETEARYAAEKEALDAEFAVIEMLENAAAEFMLRQSRENGAAASQPTAPAGPPGGDELDGGASIIAEPPPSQAAPIDMPGDSEFGIGLEGFAPEPAAETDQVGGSEIGGGLDILKPGSRWRLYRGSRTTESEGIAGEASPSTG